MNPYFLFPIIGLTASDVVTMLPTTRGLTPAQYGTSRLCTQVRRKNKRRNRRKD